ncbi:MAG: radical SAM family heme chaperone HemW [Desulfopila sp.]|nr:radical SAM family heme chaperone HemW [Desulfopila sp.]
MASLYIHIPFCLGKCDYCSFNSYAGMERIYSRYVQAVKKEIVEHFFSGKGTPLETIFFGGGTPSLLPSEAISEILACCKEYFTFHESVEISLEANPKTLDFMKLLRLRQAGINRLSVGVQSFLDDELDQLGRLHSAQDGWDCIRDAIGAGFVNISLDLMYGLPGQTLERWRWNVETALSLDLPHLSLYQLSLEEGTPLAQRYALGSIILPGEDEILQMDEVLSDMCGRAGLQQYEISNFAMQGFECRHNMNYWRNLDYIAVGAGSVGLYNGIRSRNISDPVKYCRAVENGECIVEESEKLSTEASFRESVIMGIRMTEGVSYGALYDRFGINLQEHYGDILSPLLQNGFVEFTNSHFRLTKKGRLLANQVMAELV